MPFSFGSNPTTTTSSTGFNFGTPANTFSFGQNQAAPATQAAPASTGFSFGGGATQQTPSLFGGTTSAPASGFSFSGSSFGGGAKPTTTPVATATGSLFGSAAAAKPAFGGTLGASSSFIAPSSASTGFSFASTQSSAPSFGAAQPTSGFTAPATQSGFSLGGNVPKPSFGATTAATGFSFGGGGATSASTAPATSAPTFGAQPATTGGLFGAQPSKPPSFCLGVATPAKTSSATGFSTTSTNQPGGFQLGGSTGFNLGGTSTTVTTSTASSGFKLGSAGTTEFKLGGTTSFNLTTAASQPTAPSSTTLVATTTNSGIKLGTTSSAAPSSGFQLGGATTTSSGIKLGTTSSATPSSGFQLGGGFKLGAAASTAATTGLSFGLSSAPKAAIAPSAGSFGLGSLGSTTAQASTTATSTTKLGGGLSLGGATTTTSTSSLGVASKPTVTATATETPSLRYKDLETRINKWTNELEQQEQLFLTQATQVNAWNKLLIDNSGKITDLNDEFEKVKLDQERLDQEIDFIRTQQQELEDLLLPLEEKTRQEVSSLAGAVHTHHADLERERTYNLAENIDAQLKQMVQDLREVIDHINVTSQPSDTTDPVNQIAKILSAHMDSLQWLDSNSVALQQKFTQLGKEINDRKMEQESRFRLAFD